jgi:2-polyprenyl-6-methoxyphenol hydroxylase-like FAD-dependent oxidoreductase
LALGWFKGLVLALLSTRQSTWVLRSKGDLESGSLLSEYEIVRGRLLNILYSLTKDNEKIKYFFNERVTAIQQQGKNANGRVKITFMNSLQSAAYDLVVACDGTTSRTRAIGFDCEVRDHVRPTNC